MPGTIPERLGPVVVNLDGRRYEMVTVPLEDVAEFRRSLGLESVELVQVWPPIVRYEKRKGSDER